MSGGGLVLEVAILDVKPAETTAFEAAFAEAEPIIMSMHGYRGHELRACIERVSRYVLLVHWETLEDHTVGFRQSAGYLKWKRLLHHFYEPFPTVEHYLPVRAGSS